MNTLMVTPFAPYRDGIASYAVQELRRLRCDGGDTGAVDVLSPLPSAARFHLRLGGPKGVLRLARKAANYDRTIIQFGPEMLLGGCDSSAKRVAVWAGLAGLARQTSLDVRIHEIEYGPLEQNPLERRAARLALDQADRVTVHTEAERLRLDELLGLGRRIEVVDHGRDFQPAVVESMAAARTELGLAANQFCFVSIGFLQHHKGFDRVVEAMGRLSAAGRLEGQSQPAPHLHIVGSARVDHPDITGYVDRLDRLCATTRNTTLHNRFVSDIEFDLWLQAADVIVLPYREIWSSGVVERAGLFDSQILASDLPQLRDQCPPGTMFFTDVDGLTIAMDKLRLASDRRMPAIGVGTESAPSALTPVPLSDASPVAVSGAIDLNRQPWEVSTEAPDRFSIQSQIAARARAQQLGPVVAERLTADGRRPVDALAALGRFQRPAPNSARPGVAPVKRLITRLISWQLDPIIDRLEDLQRATTQAVAQLEQQRSGGDGALDGAAVSTAGGVSSAAVGQSPRPPQVPARRPPAPLAPGTE